MGRSARLVLLGISPFLGFAGCGASGSKADASVNLDGGAPEDAAPDTHMDADVDGGGDAGSEPVSARRDFHSFVWYAGDLQDNAHVLRTLGGGGILSEGPGVLSRSIHWGRATREQLNFGPYDVNTRNFGDGAWIAPAQAAGMEVVLSINTGQGQSQGLTYSPWVTCGAALCGFGIPTLADCPPSEGHWQDWYDFVFDVVTHFDGSTEDRPEVRFFMSRTEAASPYWWGTKEELLGRLEPVPPDSLTSIDRVAPDGSRHTEQVDEALAPVMHRAVQDANAHRLRPNAALVLGPPAVFYQLAELNEALAAHGAGQATAEEVVTIARASNFYANQHPDCIPTSPTYGADACVTAISQFFGTRQYTQCHLDVAEHSLKTAHFDHLSVRSGEGHPLNEPTGGLAYTRAMQYLVGRMPPGASIWDLGTVGTPPGMDQADILPYLARDMFQRLIGAYRVPGVTHVAPTWLYSPPDEVPLSDQNICLYEKVSDVPWAERHAEADTFAMLARMVPNREGVLPGATSWTYAEGAWTAWSPDDPLFDGDSYDEAILFSFGLRRHDIEDGARFAAGWCLDQTPWEPIGFTGTCPNGDLAGILEIPADTDVAVYTGYGQFVEVVNTGDPATFLHTLDQIPALLVWGGADTDGDGIPDAIDNCPDDANADQAEDPAERLQSYVDDTVWITAPDGIGDACDARPGASD